MFADVRRGLAVAAVVRGATVTDTDGNVIDTTSSSARRASTDPAEAAAEIAAQVEADADDADEADAEPERGRRGVRRHEVTL